MFFIKCCLVLIATWTVYTQAKPTNTVIHNDGQG
ncbi:hypothetical protein MTO96_039181, partial [Rhipicephalus appendiculatus]